MRSLPHFENQILIAIKAPPDSSSSMEVGFYDFQALISTYNTKYQGYVKGIGENPWPGSIARGLENRSLKWETTDSKNIGFDFILFMNKLSGSLNYYNNETSDLLITKVLPPSAGLNDPILNVGKIRNNGIELELNWNEVVNKNFNYESTLKSR